VDVSNVPQLISGPEFARLSALYTYGILDAEPEPAFDQAVSDLATSLDIPMAQLVFADAYRFVSKAQVGLPDRPFLRNGSVPDALINERAVLDIPDLSVEWNERFGVLDGAGHLGAFLGLQVRSWSDEVIGALFVADRRSRTFTPDDYRHLERARDSVAVLLEQRRQDRLDPASGALAREPFMEQVAAILETSRAGGQPVSLVMIDISGFRERLDAVGPGLGRLVLQRISDVGRLQVRRRDSFGRLDPEHFAVLLTDTDQAGASVLEQRLHTIFGQGWDALTPVLNLNPVATGSATWRPGCSDDAHALLEAAALACAGHASPNRPALVA
jgi:diguanylate cyclase (GGDEF)-like protein